jgi:hypothetical protein
MSIQIVKIMPVEGRLILMPDRDFAAVPAEGARVYKDAFYTRAINQGDLLELPDEVPATPTPLPDSPSIAS